MTEVFQSKYTASEVESFLDCVNENGEKILVNEKNISEIKKYQKYTNTTLDYCYLCSDDNKEATSVTTGTNLLSCWDKKTTNMEFDENGYLKLSKGKSYLLHASFYQESTSASANFNIVDSNSNILYTDGFIPTAVRIGSDLVYAIDNLKENLYIAIQSTSNTKIIFNYSTFALHEINRQIVVDPVEYVNTTQCIEDTPVGHIISHMGTTAPKHYLICDGTEYNINDYPYLAQHMIDNFGSVNFFGGDGTNTFCVPDLRGEFLRGTGMATRDTGTGADVGVHQDGTQHFSIGSSGSAGSLGLTIPANVGYWTSGNNTYKADKYTIDTKRRTINSIGGSDGEYIALYTSRPTNTSVLYCIKYEPTYYMNVYNTNYLQPVLYSEEEKVIGSWIDGRPLYQKTYRLETIPKASSSSTTMIDTNITLDKYVIVYSNGTLLNSNKTSMLSFPFSNGDGYISIDCSNKGLGVLHSNGSAWHNLILTVQYIKLEDAENSFTDSTLKESLVNVNKTYTEEEILAAIEHALAEIHAEEEAEQTEVIEVISEEPTEPTELIEDEPENEPEEPENNEGGEE